ncbi:MAG TPA: peptide-methionine (S)-S-oxide reductase, partial [Sediminibacterium sp.]|nr:peptide-methionine (S)-S-oxide reductase [Sediminibacterium sp.]
MFKTSILTFALTGFFLVSCAQSPSKLANMNQTPIPPNVKTDTATFGEGCFWCTEAFFQRLNGVYKVISGYGGGFVDNPTYEQVCDKTTGHAELAKI